MYHFPYPKPVKNKIAYRRECHTRLQAAIRGWVVRRDVGPRLKVMARIHGLYAQLEPMKEIIGQLKKDKDSAKKKHKALEKDLDEGITKVQVWFINTFDLFVGKSAGEGVEIPWGGSEK